MPERSEQAENAEVVIIGGGIMGTSLAFALTQLGVKDVTLVERGVIASGASGRTGALLRRHYSNVPEATLAQLSWQTYANWSDVVGGDCGFDPCGLVVTMPTSGADAGNVERMRRNVAMQRQVGIDAAVINADELRALQPFDSVDDIAVAAYEHDSGAVDAVAATRSMAEAAARNGTRIIENRTVRRILREGERVVGVETDRGPISAEVVVCAGGAWSVPLLSDLGLEVPVTAQRVQVAVLNRPLEMPASGTMCYVDTVAGFFSRNFGPNRTLAGVGGGEFHDIVDPFSYDQHSDTRFEAALLESLGRRMPAMTRANVLYGYACLYDMTPDTHPILGPVEGIECLQLMLGFNGAGFKKGPAIGRCLAEQILNGRSDTVDLAPFCLSRFAEPGWEAPWSENEYSLSSDFGHKF